MEDWQRKQEAATEVLLPKDVAFENGVPQKLTVDEMLREWVGEFGWAQLLHFTLTSLAWTLEALQTFVMIFADRTPDWHCLPDPGSSLQRTSVCKPYASLCSLNPSQWDWEGGRSQSTVSEWNLFCGDEYKVGMVQSVFFIGCLIGAGIFGGLSDSFLGRKGVLAFVCALNAVFGFLTAISPNYWIYLILRALTGVSCGGVGLSAFVLATEPVGPSKRGAVGMSAFYFFSSGIMVLSGLAYFSSSWRHLYVITSIPSVVYCLLILPFVSESPRWYLIRGRTDDALKVLKNIATKNGNVVPSSVILATDDDDDCEEKICEDEEQAVAELSSVANHKACGTLLDVFKSPTTRMRLIIMVLIWFACAFVYYGINLNVVNLGTNLYMSVFLNAIAELPAFAITALLLGKFGRRWMLILTMVLSGISCLLGACISSQLSSYVTASEPSSSPGGNENSLLKASSLSYTLTAGRRVLGLGESTFTRVRLACGVVAVFSMAGTYNLLYIYTAELFPTVVRNAALGFASQASQAGAIIAPMVVVLGRIQATFPFAVFCLASILGGLFALKLPETLNRPMYETLQGMQRGEALY